MLKELRSECEITSLALVEHRDLVLIEKTGEVVRIKAEYYLPKTALLNLIKNGEKIIDDFPEEPMPVNHQNSKDVKALRKIYDEPFEERKKVKFVTMILMKILIGTNEILLPTSIDRIFSTKRESRKEPSLKTTLTVAMSQTFHRFSEKTRQEKSKVS